MSNRWIAGQLGRTHACINAFVKAPAAYNTVKRPGRKPKVTVLHLRRLFRAASKGDKTAAQLKSDLELPISVRRVQQLLKSCQHLRWEARKPSPWMTKAHCTARVIWAAEQLSLRREWAQVIFSDEKKFNLDGPDGIQYYWRDLRKEPQYFHKRQGGGASVMVWAAFSGNGKTKLALLDGHQDSTKYCTTLGSFLLPVASLIGGPAWVFQQDNAPIHVSRATKEWLDNRNVTRLSWPARSPDLNPVENLWGYLVRRVYRNDRRYNNVADLKRSLQLEWNMMPPAYFGKLLGSMNKRCVEVIQKKGRVIDY